MPINPLVLPQGAAGLQYGLSPQRQQAQAPPQQRGREPFMNRAQGAGIADILSNPIRVESGTYGEAIAEALAAGLRGMNVRDERQAELDAETVAGKRDEARRSAISQALAGFDPANPQGMVGALAQDAPEQAMSVASALIGNQGSPPERYGDLERIDGRLGQRNQITGQYDWAPQTAAERPPAAPAGYRPTQDGNLEAIPGGPADLRQTAEGRARLAQMESSELQLTNGITALNRVLGFEEGNLNADATPANGTGQVNSGSTGQWPNRFREWGFNQGGQDLERALDPVRAILSFENLAEMRRNSETGGALGSIAVRELELLASTVASLEVDQNPEQLRANLLLVRRRFIATQQAIAAARAEMEGGSVPAQADAGDGGGTLPPGVTADEWRVMTPEERALFQQ